jgi:hypothetical protein
VQRQPRHPSACLLGCDCFPSQQARSQNPTPCSVCSHGATSLSSSSFNGKYLLGQRQILFTNGKCYIRGTGVLKIWVLGLEGWVCIIGGSRTSSSAVESSKQYRVSVTLHQKLLLSRGTPVGPCNRVHSNHLSTTTESPHNGGASFVKFRYARITITSSLVCAGRVSDDGINYKEKRLFISINAKHYH